MKKLLFTVLNLIVILAINAQEIIKNPRFGISSTPYIGLTEVELTDEATILSFHVNIPQNNWVAIHEKSYIQPVGDTTRLYITKAEGAEIATQIMWEKDKMEEISYRLYFPPLNKDVTRIDFGEPVGNSWNFYDIEVREQEMKSPVPPGLAGHWFSEETGHWSFSLLDSLAVIGGMAWHYDEILSSEDAYEINLVNNQQKIKMLCQIENGTSCLMKYNGNGASRFSKDISYLNTITDERQPDITSPGHEKVSYSGLIRGFSTRLGVQTGIIRLVNFFSNQPETYIIPIQKDGSFSVEFPLIHPQEITVSLPSGTERIFFEPGKTLFHLANTGMKTMPSLLMGESAGINYSLMKTRDVATPMMEFLQGIINMSDNEYIEYVLKTKTEEQKRLEQIQKEYKLNPGAVRIRQLEIDYRAAANALRYNGNMNMAKLYANMKLKKEEQHQTGPLAFDITLLEKFKDTPVNDMPGLMSGEYTNLFQSLYYTDINRQQAAYYYHLSVLGSHLQKQGIQFTGEENDMLAYINASLIDNYEQEKNILFNQTYREVLQKFIQKYQNEFLEVSNRFYMENLQTNLAAMGQSPEGLPMEIMKTRTFMGSLNKENIDETIDAEYKESIRSIKADFLKELVMSAYYTKKAEAQAAKNSKVPELKTEGDRLFDKIIKPYRGKIIYVDFWATWCGPCLAGIEKIKPLKEELAGKDIVFLYITNPTSPDAEYKKRIPDIKGEHVRVSADEWNYLTGKFNIYGIPHYAIVNKEGFVIHPHLMPEENSRLRKRLMEELEK